MTDFSTPAHNDAENQNDSELVTKLKRALSKDGDFPASAKIVTELRQLSSDPNTTANQITEIILKEPSLGTRVLHLVNSSFYRRAKPIMTVSQAVVQIGMKPLAELCSGLVLLQKFVPVARRGGVFANCLRKMTVSSLLAGALGSEMGRSMGGGKSHESGYLAGTFAEIGALLLAYYFPQVYENAAKRAESKGVEVGTGIFEITGLSALQLSHEVLAALDLPIFYRHVLQASIDPKAVNSAVTPPSAGELQEIAKAARTVQTALAFSSALTSGKPKKQIDDLVNKAEKLLGLSNAQLRTILSMLPDAFKSHCGLMELDLAALPEYLSTYGVSEPAPDISEVAEQERDIFSQYLDEIRQAVDAREPSSSIITTCMETLAFGLKFDRVLLLILGSGKSSFGGRMLLGQSAGIDPKSISRALGPKSGSRSPETIAFRDSHPVFTGEPILEGGWPIAVLPVGFGSKAVGVIYADRIGDKAASLTARETAAIGVLVELLDRALGTHS